MTPQLSQPADKNIDAELDRLTYSAYLLTLDPGLALSVVMAALDDSVGKPDANLLRRTVELSLQQLRRVKPIVAVIASAQRPKWCFMATTRFLAQATFCA
jgi:hypothetical protein